MTKEAAFAALETLDRQIVLLDHIEATLAWDQEISLSERGVEERSSQLGWIAEQRHHLVSDHAMEDLLAQLEGYEPDSSFQRELIAHRRREYEKQVKLPSSLVRSISEQASKAHQSWVEARKAGSWSRFSPDFHPMVEMVREKADLLRSEGQCLYDPLLDNFERGMRTDEVDRLFSSIKEDLKALAQRMERHQVDDAFLKLEYPISAQEAFSRQVLKDMGFDFSRGSMAVSVHPFTTTVGGDDIRITTRYTDPSVADSLFSTIHEGGHALYEMGANSGLLKGTSLANGASLGMHESQSRLWENIIGKSAEFWEHYYPLFADIFPAQTSGVSLGRFVQAINKVQRNPIRVNADEVNYSLHIILRFELERQILDGNLAVADIPEAWDAKHEALFGYRPGSLQEGALQDVHWSSGDFGYFPTYALGNLYGAQIWERVKKDLDVSDLLKTGQLGQISSLLREHIYQKGALQSGLDTLVSYTSKGLDATLFTSYLENKFSRLFG
ncbi:MAG: carboxypeptidase M32 [Spirochaetia bacterium]|nr:carboxypeptidase M32 [Spirochaetia bacterium]NCC88870.1 carboxypeptidase M32 [Spirochaetia bacterium]